MRRRLHVALVGAGLLILLLVGSLRFGNGSLRLNLAHLQFNHLMFPAGPLAQNDAAQLARVGEQYVEVAGGGEQPYAVAAPVHDQIEEMGCRNGSSSLLAWLMAARARYQRDFAATGAWLLQAAASYPANQVTLPLMLPIHAVPNLATGDIQLMWDNDYWMPRRDSLPLVAAVEPATNLLTISYENVPQVEDRFIYQWRGNMSLPAWYAVEVVSRLEPGAFLTLEIRTEHGLKRYVNYEPGTGEWETFVLPLEGNQLRHIYILVTDSADAVGPPGYEQQLKPLTLLLEPEYQQCVQVQ